MTANPNPDLQTFTRHFILGTAGHIDHGKSTLIKALTGVDPDRLPEEHKRGMTIELGFAKLVIDDAVFGIVDVPGHERFIRTMVAGATAIDLAVLVIAADDSVMPQTIEHVDILQLLGVTRAIVALTKIDCVDADLVELAKVEIAELLSGTFFADTPIVPVSSMTGAGLDKLRRAICAIAADSEPKPAQRPFRMCVDRTFSLAGRGTIATGSVQRGVVEVGDTLEVLPDQAACRVRNLQTHGQSRERVITSQRAAINLSGVDKDELMRGCELATPGYLTPTKMVDARLNCLNSCERGIKSAAVVRLEIGTVELPARVVLLSKPHLGAGESTHAQLRTGTAFCAAFGQRFIIRDENASRTIGGGIILRPVSRRRRVSVEKELQSLAQLESDNAADRLEEVLRYNGLVRPDDLVICAQAGVELNDIESLVRELESDKRLVPLPESELIVTPGAVEEITSRLARWLARFHRNNPELPGKPVESAVGWLERRTQKNQAKPLLAWCVTKKRLKRLGRFVCLPEFAPKLTGADERILREMIEEVRKAGHQPPALTELACAKQADKKRMERLASLAAAMGELVKVDAKLYLHVEAESTLRSTVADLIRRQGSITLSEIREALGSTRKYMVPMMEYLDRIGFTARDGDKRKLARPADTNPEEDR